MSRKSVISLVACFSLALGVLGLIGCENGNLFGKLHKSGDSGDVTTLQSDAQIALEHGDFSKALSLYEQILAQDADNSNALNGAAIAAVAGAGLNFGQILANITSQTAAPSISDLSSLIAAARTGYSAQDVSADSILAGVDLAALDSVLDLAICRLTRIVSGLGDNVIRQDDAAVILNLACLRLVRGALRPIRAEFFDIRNTGGRFELVQLEDADTVCGNSANDALVIASAKDLVAGYVLFNRAVNVLAAPSDSITGRLREQMDAAITDALNGGGGNNLPGTCVSTINAAGINASNFRSNTEAFTPPSGC